MPPFGEMFAVNYKQVRSLRNSLNNLDIVLSAGRVVQEVTLALGASSS